MKTRSRIFFAVPLLFACLAMGTTACDTRQGGDEAASTIEGGGEVVAFFDGEELSLDDFRAYIEKLPAQVRPMVASPERRKQFLETFVLTRLLVKDAKSRGLDKDEEIQSKLREQEDRLILQKVFEDLQGTITISDEEAEAYYGANQEEFSTTEIRASHILVEDEASAGEVLVKVRENPESFAKLAKEISKDGGTASKGGDLGFFGRGRMVPAFEQAAFALKEPGDISEVVKSPFGNHIIMLTEKKVGEPRPLDQVKEQIRAKLISEQREKKMEAYFEQLKADAKMRIDEEVLARYEIAAPAPPGGAAGLPGAIAPGRLPADAGNDSPQPTGETAETNPETDATDEE